MTRYALCTRLLGPPHPHSRAESEQARNITTPPGFDSRNIQSVASLYTDWSWPGPINKHRNKKGCKPLYWYCVTEGPKFNIILTLLLRDPNSTLYWHCVTQGPKFNIILILCYSGTQIQHYTDTVLLRDPNSTLYWYCVTQGPKFNIILILRYSGTQIQHYTDTVLLRDPNSTLYWYCVTQGPKFNICTVPSLALQTRCVQKSDSADVSTRNIKMGNL